MPARKGFCSGVRKTDIGHPPCPLINWVAEVKTAADQPMPRQDWEFRASADEPLEHFASFTFDFLDVPAMIRGAEAIYRYPMVDRDALHEALAHQRIAGAGLDVQPMEPMPPDHPIWTTPNILLTPHIAGGSQFRTPRLLDRFVRNLARLRAGEPLEGVIDRSKGY